MKRTVLLGGGHAHALALLAWAQAPLAGVELILVSPAQHSLYSGMVPGWLAGQYPAEALQIDLGPLCCAAGAQLLLDEALALDPQAQQLQLAEGGPLRYDLLSINTGSTLSAPAHDGPVLALRPLGRLLAQWPVLLAQWVQGDGPLALDLVGGGAAGVEVMLAALHRLRALRPDRPITPRLFCASARLLPGHNPGVARRAQAALHQAGVQLLVNQRWTAGDTPAGGWLLWAAGAQAPAWLGRSGLGLSADGYVQVSACLQSRSHASVFAAGDSAAFDPPLDKSGVRAVRMAPVLAHNLGAAVRGQPLQAYRPQRDTLALLAIPGTGTSATAIASRGRWLALQGAWVGRWKDHLDRRFMQRFTPEALASLTPLSSPP